VLVRLCRDYELEPMFLPGLPGLGRCTFILDNLLQSFMPDIAKHLVRCSPRHKSALFWRSVANTSHNTNRRTRG
jgi:hypothetical protein